MLHLYSTSSMGQSSTLSYLKHRSVFVFILSQAWFRLLEIFGVLLFNVILWTLSSHQGLFKAVIIVYSMDNFKFFMVLCDYAKIFVCDYYILEFYDDLLQGNSE